MLAYPMDATAATTLNPRDVFTRPPRSQGVFDLAPTRDCDSLIATFAMFIARLSRCTQVDLALTEARPTIRTATLRIRLDPAASVAAMHCEVDAALERARAQLTTAPRAHQLPVGIALVTQLDDALPARLLTLALTRDGAARWYFDQGAFSRAHIHALADRFTQLLAIRATARWIRAPVAGVPLRLEATTPG